MLKQRKNILNGFDSRLVHSKRQKRTAVQMQHKRTPYMVSAYTGMGFGWYIVEGKNMEMGSAGLALSFFVQEPEFLIERIPIKEYT